jgi:hypothetical protein
MDSLNISTGEKRIPIVRDGVPAGELVFNPDDVVFAEKFYRLLGDFQTKFEGFKAKSIEVEKVKGDDANGIPLVIGGRIELVKEVCIYIHEQIDWVFGANTSAVVFGGVYNLAAIEQFLDGVKPFIQPARVQKIQKYTNGNGRKHKRGGK